MNAERTARVIDETLGLLRAHADPACAAAGEDLVRALMDFYGAGLTRLAALLRQPGTGPRDILDDDLVTGLLVLHDLHPDDVPTRVARALASVPAHPAEIAGLDPAAGTLRVRLTQGHGCGCASTTEGAREAITAALACLAPEIEHVDVERAPEPGPALLQITARPPAAGAAR